MVTALVTIQKEQIEIIVHTPLVLQEEMVATAVLKVLILMVMA